MPNDIFLNRHEHSNRSRLKVFTYYLNIYNKGKWLPTWLTMLQEVMYNDSFLKKRIFESFSVLMLSVVRAKANSTYTFQQQYVPYYVRIKY